MKAFQSKYSENYHKRRREDSRNPTKGRTARESNTLRRQCLDLAVNLRAVLEATDCYRFPGMYPIADVITDRDDDAVIDWRAIAENTREDGYLSDHDGLLVNMQDDGIKASNRIEAVVVYEAERGEGLRDTYMTRKTIFSPFACDEWGSAPLTLHQWRILALDFIEARVYWQWEPAVNYYAEQREMPSGYVFQYIVGWNLVACVRPSQQPTIEEREPQRWIAPIIYSLAISGCFKANMMNGYQE